MADHGLIPGRHFFLQRLVYLFAQRDCSLTRSQRRRRRVRSSNNGILSKLAMSQQWWFEFQGTLLQITAIVMLAIGGMAFVSFVGACLWVVSGAPMSPDDHPLA